MRIELLYFQLFLKKKKQVYVLYPVSFFLQKNGKGRIPVEQEV